jgi:hypothetical protein
MSSEVQARRHSIVENCRELSRPASRCFFMSRAALTVLVLTTLTAPAGAAPAGAAPAPTDTIPTPQLLVELATGKRAVGELVDAQRGLLFMDHFQGPGEGGSTIENTRACTGELAKLVKRRWPQIADAIKTAKANGSLTCKPAALTCRAGGQGEWDAVLHFTFAAHTPATAGRPLDLVAIAIDDEVLVGDDAVAAEHARQARQLAELTPCP